MSYYLSGLLRVTDAAWQKEYGEKISAVIRRHGGEILVAASAEKFEGPSPAPDRLVVLRCPDQSAAISWYRDPEHVELIKLRQTGATFELFGGPSISKD